MARREIRGPDGEIVVMWPGKEDARKMLAAAKAELLRIRNLKAAEEFRVTWIGCGARLGELVRKQIGTDGSEEFEQMAEQWQELMQILRKSQYN